MAFAQCDYTLELRDEFGDGWQGFGVNGQVELVIGGVATQYTINPGTGSPSTQTFTISVTNNDPIEINYTPPFIPGDASFTLTDSEGILVYDSPAGSVPSSNPVFTGTISCPTCPAIQDDISVNNVEAREADISWTAGGAETEWIVEFGISPLTLGTGTERIATSNNPYVLDGLTPETTYDVYVRSRCSATDRGSARGPISFTTLPSCPRPDTFTELGTNPNSATFLAQASGNFSNTGFYQIGEAPYTLGTSAAVAVNTLPALNITGLRSNTTYDVYVRFDCGNGDLSQYSDQPYTFTTPKNCEDITANMVSNLTFTTAELSWTAGGTETEWQIEYGVAPLGSGATFNTTVASTTEVLTGLLSATDYEYCITAICGPLDSADPVCGTFSTPSDYCGADPLVDSGGIADNYSNNENITYTICPDNPGDIVTLDFTEFDVESSSNTSCFDNLSIYDGDSTTAPLISPAGSATSWCFNRATGIGTGDLTLANIQATSTSGCITLVFTSNPTNTGAGFLATVTCTAPPACSEPDQLAISQVYGGGANFTWNSNADDVEWEVEVQPAGTAQGTAGAVYTSTVTDSREVIRGLMPSTPYDVYVRENCISGDQSIWAGPRSFTTTACDAVSAPYTGAGGVGAGNNFDNFPGNCWDEVNNTPITGIPVASNGAWDNFDFANDSSSPNGNSALFPIFSNGPMDNDWLMSPTFDLGAAGHNMLLNYRVALTEAFGQGPSNFGADDNVKLFISDDNGFNWTILRTYDASSNLQPSASNEVIDLSSYSGEVKFAFVGSLGPDGNTTADIEFFVDEFRIATTASISSNEDLEVAVYPNPTDGVLNLNSVEEIQKISVFNLMGQKVLQVNKQTELLKSIDMNSLNSGIYLVKVETQNAEQTVRVVKN
ncbi:hypothetical protein BST97_07320 [Nonlabens spongiae]|uniref:Uncharacterized protein n=1 Tax=Nonlabens spongiae TaxID=331648 RepID=A0A1W6MJN9_9FLAO|nr:hypothetical protein BST97_07320 [Nonlabens spongiae]